jgi:hypothetical protein
MSHWPCGLIDESIDYNDGEITMKPILLLLSLAMLVLGCYFAVDWVGWSIGDNKSFNLCACVSWGAAAAFFAFGANGK